MFYKARKGVIPSSYQYVSVEYGLRIRNVDAGLLVRPVHLGQLEG